MLGTANLFGIFLVGGGILILGLTLYIIKDVMKNIAVFWLVICIVSGGIWSMIEGLSLLISHEFITILLVYLARPFGITTGVALFLFVLEYETGKEVNLQTALVFFAIPVFVHIIMLIKPGYIMNIEIVEGGVPDVTFVGVGFLYMIYAILIHFFAIGILIRGIYVRREFHRKPTVLILGIYVISAPLAFLPFTGIVPAYVNTTGIGIIIGTLIISGAIVRFGIFSTNIPRENVFDEIEPDVFISLNSLGNVVEYNSAAKDVFDNIQIGKKIDDLCEDYPGILDVVEGEKDTIEVHSNSNTFDVVSQTIEYGRSLDGQLIIMRDITEVKQRERELELVQNIFKRVFRHNIRNELNVVTGNAGIIQEASDQEYVLTAAETIETSSRKLLNHSEKARLIDDIITGDREMIEQGVDLLVSSAVEECLQDYPDANIDVSLNECGDVSVNAVGQAYKAVSNAIENSLEHNDSEVDINVSCHCGDGEVKILVEDTGGGINESEVQNVMRDEETSLEHGSGVGLWVMRWVTEVSDGNLEFYNTEQGTVVEILFNIVEE